MKKFKDLVPGNSLYILCMNPENDEPVRIANCIVRGININNDKAIVGVQFTDPDDKSKMIINYFRVNSESNINDSLKENVEHRMEALFETKENAIDEYIHYCEDKIQQYKDNITKVGGFI